MAGPTASGAGGRRVIAVVSGGSITLVGSAS
jgi:hypothetical protein